MTDNALATRDIAALAAEPEHSVEQLTEQRRLIERVMDELMVEDVHYGKIPGTQKPTLLKPGAEKLNQTFKLRPAYPKSEMVEQFFDDGHLYVRATCELYHIPTGTLVAEGLASCTTRESRYAYRKASKICPVCQMPLFKSKPPREGWFCWKAKDGCGANFTDDAPEIASQQVGRVENPDLPDLYNTILKIACKRALIAATLNATAASDVFTQDMEDRLRNAAHEAEADVEDAEIVEPPPPGNDPPPTRSAPPPATTPPPAETPGLAEIDKLCVEFGTGETIDAINTLRAAKGLFRIDQTSELDPAMVTPERIAALRQTLLEQQRAATPVDPDDPVAPYSGESPVEALERAHAAAKARGIDRPCPACGAECEAIDDPPEGAPRFKCTNDACLGYENKKKTFTGPWRSWSTDPWRAGGQVETEIKKRAQQQLGVEASAESEQGAGSGYDDSSSEAVGVDGETVSGSERRPSDEAVVPAGAQS